MHELADAIREVTARVQRAIDEGHRSRAIDADDLVEVLLAIADRLDPFEPPDQLPQIEDGVVHPTYHCPNCGEYETKNLQLSEGNIRCKNCGTGYYPGEG